LLLMEDSIEQLNHLLRANAGIFRIPKTGLDSFG
jgi:hypothetical protein